MTQEERQRARDVLDLEDGRWPTAVLGDEAAARLLTSAHRIAVVGASPDRARPSHGVMRYLVHHGYECVPVNPQVREVMGLRSFASLEQAVAETGPFDIVDVFRRPEHAAAIARSTVETGCGALWLQLGVVDREAARICHDAGVPIVMDRCTALEHRRLRSRA
jgi:uncharacterized protein